jgi:hypothetical protein
MARKSAVVNSYNVRLYEHKDGSYTLGWASKYVKLKKNKDRVAGTWRGTSRVKLSKILGIKRSEVN